MHPIRRLDPSFVEHLPESLEPGKLYVSIDFASTVHLCCCGCQSEVIAPLSPTDWKMTYDGVNVSMHPSIGNWSLACRSHYVIRNGKVRWAGAWSDEQIARGRQNDKNSKRRYYSEDQEPKLKDVVIAAQTGQTDGTKKGLLTKFFGWMGFES